VVGLPCEFPKSKPEQKHPELGAKMLSADTCASSSGGTVAACLGLLSQKAVASQRALMEALLLHEGCYDTSGSAIAVL